MIIYFLCSPFFHISYIKSLLTHYNKKKYQKKKKKKFMKINKLVDQF
jgi:hypothetical protein